MSNRWDETWHRLREWTNGQGPSERLAAQVLLAEGFSSMDPSHPLGGSDRGKDALAIKDGARWVMAVYFPRGQQRFNEIKRKFLADHEGVAVNHAVGMAFVTNQELTLGERRELLDSITTPAEIFHLERVTAILDQPAMHGVRAQFLQIPAPAAVTVGEQAAAPSDFLIAAQVLEENIEDLRRRIAHAIPLRVYWSDLLVWNVFEEHRRALMRYPEVFKPVSDSYRSFRELNESVSLGSPIPADAVQGLEDRVSQMAHASAQLRALIAELSGGSESTPPVSWYRTELSRDLIKCDLCGEEADTVHFLSSDRGYPKTDDVDAVFACPAHDAHGYHVNLDRWFSPDDIFPDHLETKAWGPAALSSLNARFNTILRDAAERDRRR